MKKFFEKIIFGAPRSVDEDENFGSHPLMSAGARQIAPIIVDSHGIEYEGREYRQGEVQLRLNIPVTVSVDDQGDLVVHANSPDFLGRPVFSMFPSGFKPDGNPARENWRELVKTLASVLRGEEKMEIKKNFDSSSF